MTDDAGHVTAIRSEAIATEPHEASLRASLASLPVWLSVGLFFVYTGLELTLGLWAYSLLTESRGIGAASLPALAGILADHHSLEAIPWFITGCVLVMGGLYRAPRRPALRPAA